MSFRVEYKRNGTGPAMFQRHVRFQVSIQISNFEIYFSLNDATIFYIYFQVDLSAICKQEEVSDTLFAITFTLLSGK